jgi:MEDS: MEthanogen/methylotroph, DcmR Sensory domain/Histidine kinase-like ATPase domain
MLTELGTTPGRPGSHVVQFYDSDDELTEPAASFLAEAIRGGGTAVLIAQPGHRARFAQALAARGISVAAARGGGMLIERDAARTLALLGARQGLDPAAFETVIGALLRTARRRGGPVRIYGEMVGLVWRRNQTGRALALESLWNELGSREQFLLFCSYPQPKPQQANAVRQVAGLHSAVHAGTLPDALQAQPPDMAAFYDPDPRSPALARQMVRDVLTDRHLPHLAEDAIIVVSELASNAVRHARSGFAVTLTSTPLGVRITVTDSSGQRPALHCAAPSDSAGRGLQLVDRLANRWGVAPGPAGKMVWAELR